MGGPSAESSSRKRGPDEAFCRNCGAIISDRAEICPECGVRQRPPPNSSLDRVVDDLLGGGNPFVAAVLSAVVPGLGQLYNRELTKGLAFIVGSMLAALSTLVFVGIVLYPAVWVYAIYDAYKVADRQSRATGTVNDPGRPTSDEFVGRGDTDDADTANDGSTADQDVNRPDTHDNGAARRD